MTLSNKQTSWLSFAVKSLLNQGHLSELYEPYEDTVPGSSVLSRIPAHPTLTTSKIIAQGLVTPAPVLSHLADNSIVKFFGDTMVPPTQGLKLASVDTVPDYRAWIAVDGGLTPDAETDDIWALQAPGVGFIDAWADGVDATANSNGYTYQARFWHGEDGPADGGEILSSHPAGPLWSASTGILVFTEGNPYDYGIPETHSIWFTGYLYIGNTAADVITSSGGGSVTRIAGVVPGSLSGLATLNTTVEIELGATVGGLVTTQVFVNGQLQLYNTDYTYNGDKTRIRFLQKRRRLFVGDEIQIFNQS